MSLLTRCPACETLYKLVPDQLRISQGWVKCGQCGEIFDASRHLIQVAVDPVLETSPGAMSLATAAVTGVAVDDSQTRMPPQDTGSTANTDNAANTEYADSADSTPAGLAPVGQTGLVADDLHQSEPSDPTEPAPAALLLEQTPPPESAPLPEQTPPPESAPLPEQTQLSEQSLPPEPAPLAPDVSFLGATRQPSVWRSRTSQWLLWLAALCLIGALFFQWLYRQRDHLAATYPDLKPLLQQLCQPIGCSVRPLQQINAIAIDSAAFNRISADRYRLGFVIKNLSMLALALPSVELTLTDTQDQVMVRRVLSPQEMFAAHQVIMPTAELSVNLVLRLEAGEATPAAMGYRLLAFYP